MAKDTKGNVKDKAPRAVAFLLPGGTDLDDLDLPEEAVTLADMPLTLDEPPVSSSGNSYNLGGTQFADPNRPTIVKAVVDGKLIECPIGGQFIVYLTKKAVERARSSR